MGICSFYLCQTALVVNTCVHFLSISPSPSCREVSTEEGEKKARELDAMFIEVSAKSGHNIKSVSVMVTYRELPKMPTVLAAIQEYMV